MSLQREKQVRSTEHMKCWEALLQAHPRFCQAGAVYEHQRINSAQLHGTRTSARHFSRLIWKSVCLKNPGSRAETRGFLESGRRWRRYGTSPTRTRLWSVCRAPLDLEGFISLSPLETSK